MPHLPPSEIPFVCKLPPANGVITGFKSPPLYGDVLKRGISFREMSLRSVAVVVAV